MLRRFLESKHQSLVFTITIPRHMRPMEKLEIANLLLKRGEMFDILFHEAEEELWLGYVLLPFKFARVTVSTAGGWVGTATTG